MTCKSCGKTLSDGTNFCDNCGASLTVTEAAPRQSRNIKPLLIVLIVLSAVMIFLMVCGIGLFAAFRYFTAQKLEIMQPEPSVAQTVAPTSEAYTQATTEATAPPAYPYMEYSSPTISDSSLRYLTADDIDKMSATTRMLARSEIYARHGVIFADAELASYFQHQSWYQPSVAEEDFDEDELTEYESANIALIEVYEKIAQGKYAPSADNPYMPYYDPYTELLLPKSSNTKLTAQDLSGLNNEQLVIVRNQIIALHGYTFRDQHLMEYFMQCSWYRPYTVPGRSDLVVGMSTLEFENMDFISQYEQNPQPANDLDSLDTAYGYKIETPYYTVTLPNYWQEYAICDKYESNGLINVSFDEKFDADYYGGHVFTLMTLPLDAYYDFPQYKHIGIFTDGVNHYRLIALLPSDVQFSFEHQALYTKMSGEIDGILNTLTLKDGYAFTE